jgi:hypothetical protein
MKLTNTHKQAIMLSIKNDMPDFDYVGRKARAEKILFDAMSPLCKKMFKQNPKALRQEYVSSIYELNVYSNSIYLVVGDADNVETLLKPLLDEANKRKDALSKARSAVYGCNTRKQLIDTFPEFSKYAPVEAEASRLLPAVANVVAGLVKEGWKPK